MRSRSVSSALAVTDAPNSGNNAAVIKDKRKFIRLLNSILGTCMVAIISVHVL